MKKLFFILSMSLMTTGAFASNEVKEKKKKAVTACCTQSDSHGEPNSLGYVSVTITKCEEAKDHNTAKVAACNNALAAARKSVNALIGSKVQIISE